VLALGGGVLLLDAADLAEVAADGKPEKEKAGGGEDHADDVEADGE